MKNKEFYTEELLNIAFEQSPIAIDKDTEAPVKCDEIACSKCLLSDFAGDCATPLREWSEKEFTFKLSNKEKAFLNMFTYPSHGYIARNKNKAYLYLFSEQPVRSETEEKWIGPFPIRISPDLFPFITYDSNKAWSLEELGKK